MKKEIMKVAIYSRANDPAVLKKQTAELRVYARENKINILGVYVEDRTNKNGYPAFHEMIKAIKNGKLDTILLYSMDRLPRNFRESSTLFGSVGGGTSPKILLAYGLPSPVEKFYLKIYPSIFSTVARERIKTGIKRSKEVAKKINK